ncbi:SPFH/Band 7/PHB domain protein, partial [Cellulomonas triticagri]
TDPKEALAEARRESLAATADATSAGTYSGRPFDPVAEAGQRPQPGHAAPPQPPVDPEAPPAP